MSASHMRRIRARWLLGEDGWRADATVRIGPDGRIEAIADAGGAAAAGHVDERGAQAVDLLVPGMPNAHCHAFQYGIAGLTEPASGAGDSFWTWRERMYASLAALDADGLRRVAETLYRALRARGYTSVAEFHYVHRLGAGGAADTAAALVEAARAAGVRLLLLPVLYRRGGLDDSPLAERQRGFGLTLDAYGTLLATLASWRAAQPHLTVGIAPHSLRAVSPADLDEALRLRAALVPDCPVHIHIAEQTAEVDAVRVHLGATPIAWLLANAPVDAEWTLVHATHATPDELAGVAARGATACVCTTTEANLGDGFFDIERWWALGGSLAVGSDSNVGIDPAEELRWLEYQARLRGRVRSVLVDAASAHPGTALWRRAVRGGRRALGETHAGIAVGAPAELLELRRLDGSISPDEAMDDHLFAQRLTAMAPLG